MRTGSSSYAIARCSNDQEAVARGSGAGNAVSHAPMLLHAPMNCQSRQGAAISGSWWSLSARSTSHGDFPNGLTAAHRPTSRRQ